jgi:hypothetical protein
VPDEALHDGGDDGVDDDGFAEDDHAEGGDDDSVWALHILALEMELALEERLFGPEGDEPSDDGLDPVLPPAAAGSASSSGDPPVAPEPADTVVAFGCGVLTYYASSETIVASCKTHGKACRFTKTVRPKRLTNDAGGRVLGKLSAWLLLLDPEEGGDPELSVAAHIEAKDRDMPFPQRHRARQLLVATDNSLGLFEKERLPDDGDFTKEPDGNP